MKYQGLTVESDSVFFKDLFYRYFDSLVVFAIKLVKNQDVARDIVQDVFLKLWDVQGDFKNELAVKTYLFYSTKNTCIDYYRKNLKNKQQVELDESICHEEHYLKELLREETFRIIDEALESLGEKSRVIIKSSMMGCTNKEISEDLQISVNTVKTLKFRAYRILRGLLGTQLLLTLINDFKELL